MKRTIVSLILATVGTNASVAVAKQHSTLVAPTESSESADEASQRFQQGVKLYRERSFDAALAEFIRAYELSPNYRVLYNIAQVQAERGDFVTAVTYFQRYLEDGGDTIEASRIAEVQTEMARFEGRIAKLKFATNVEGAELVVDGEPAGTLPSDGVRVNSGIRRIVVRKKGFDSVEQRLTLTGGETKTITVNLTKSGELTPQATKAVPSTKQDSSTVEPDSSWHASTGFWVSLAATGVAAGATAVFEVLTTKSKNDFDAELNRFPGSRSRIDDARKEMKRNALITDGCGVLTLLGLGTTIYFAATGGEKVPKQSYARQFTLKTAPALLDGNGLLWQIKGQF